MEFLPPRPLVYPNTLKNSEIANAESPQFDSEKTSPPLDIGAAFPESKMGISATVKTDSSTCLGIQPSTTTIESSQNAVAISSSHLQRIIKEQSVIRQSELCEKLPLTRLLQILGTQTTLFHLNPAFVCPSCHDTSIERCCDFPQNEEESVRTILLLSQQIKKTKDRPQVMIHNRGHSDETMDFSVLIVRLVEPGKEQPFTLTKLPGIVGLIPLRNTIIGGFRGKYQKQAIGFIAQCSKASFQRYNHSSDMVRARETVIRSLRSSLGPVRDVNGGLFFQQNQLLEGLSPLLSDNEKEELYIVENLFHSLTPSITKNMICTEHMLTLFRHFQELRSSIDLTRKNCITEKSSTAAFVSFICPKRKVPEEILLLKSYLQVPDHSLATCQTLFSHRCFGFAICFSDDTSTQNRFIESAQRIVSEKKPPSAHPRAVRLCVHEKELSLDPKMSTNGASGSIVQMLYEGLTKATSDSTVSNAIAESVSISDDSLTLTFSLRPSVWSNNTPVTAHDFVYAWKRAVLPECTNPYCHLLFPIQNARHIKAGRLPPDALRACALSNTTLVVHLEHPCPEFLLLCSHWIYSPLPQPTDEQLTSHKQCPDHTTPTNGPFKIAQQSSPSTIILERNPHFWDSDRHLPAGVTFRLNQRSPQAHGEFKLGEIDWIGDPIIPILSKKRSERLCSMPISSVRAVALNVQNPLFSSKMIRAALSLAVKRSSLCRGGCEPSVSLLPKSHSSLPSPSALPFNMTQAQAFFRKGLREQGVVSSSLPPLRFITPDFPEDRRVASEVAKAWNEAFGLTIHLQHISHPKFIEAVHKESYDLALTQWHSVSKNSALAFELFKEPFLNPSKWSFDPFSSLITKASLTHSPDHRRPLIQQAEQILIEEMPVIPLVDCRLHFLNSPSFQKFTITPFGTLDFLRISS